MGLCWMFSGKLEPVQPLAFPVAFDGLGRVGDLESRDQAAEVQSFQSAHAGSEKLGCGRAAALDHPAAIQGDDGHRGHDNTQDRFLLGQFAVKIVRPGEDCPKSPGELGDKNARDQIGQAADPIERSCGALGVPNFQCRGQQRQAQRIGRTRVEASNKNREQPKDSDQYRVIQEVEAQKDGADRGRQDKQQPILLAWRHNLW